MKTRSGFLVMLRLIGLVKPLVGYMLLAILMGLVGHLCASFITIFGGFAVLKFLGAEVPVTLAVLFVSVLVFAILRGIFRYAEQACNHYIAFKLLALIRDKVFQALRRLCPAKLEGKDRGNLIAVITSDIELLEVFYAHTISPSVIALLFSAILCLFIGSYHPLLGVIALLAYLSVGVFMPLIVSRASGDTGMEYRTKAGELSGFLLDSLRGLSETLQYQCAEKRLDGIRSQTEALSVIEERLKKTAGNNTAVTNTIILFFDLCMLGVSALLYDLGNENFGMSATFRYKDALTELEEILYGN